MSAVAMILKDLGWYVTGSDDNSVFKIDNIKVKPDSKIFITPVTNTDGEVLVVEEKLDGSFKVVIKNAIATDIDFDYWVVKVE